MEQEQQRRQERARAEAEAAKRRREPFFCSSFSSFAFCTTRYIAILVFQLLMFANIHHASAHAHSHFAPACCHFEVCFV